MGAYFLLAGAIVAEVVGTVSLKFAEGFTRVVPSIVVVVGYGVAFFLLAQVLKTGVSIGVVYAIWSGFGVALVALIGALFLGDRMNFLMVTGLVLVISGVALLELGEAR